MKRGLRILILGPVFLIAGAAFALVLPLVFLILWLMDDDLGEMAVAAGEIAREAAKEVWG